MPPFYGHALMALRNFREVVLVSVDTAHGIPVLTWMHGLVHQLLTMRIHLLSFCNLPIEHSREGGISSSNQVWSLVLVLSRI